MTDVLPSTLDEAIRNHEPIYSRVRVYTRIRPNFKYECQDGKEFTSAIEVLDKETLAFKHVKKGTSIKKNKFFTFTRVFDSKITTEHIFNEVLRDCMFESALTGKKMLIMSGGHERSGKTHTILGQMAQPGVILHCVRDLLIKIQDKAFRSNTTMHVKFLEFVGDKFIDLCGGKYSLSIQTMGTPDERNILGCTSFLIKDFLHFVRIFKAALRISSGLDDYAYNNFSTKDEGIRSSTHFVVEIEIRQEERLNTNNDEIRYFSSTICFVDLARVDSRYKTSDSENSVNMSLHNLNKCFSKMRDISMKIFKNSQYIQFDRSAFTLFLQKYLQGSGSEFVYFNHIAAADSLRDDIKTHLKLGLTISEISVNCVGMMKETQMNANKYALLMNELASIGAQITKNLSYKDHKTGGNIYREGDHTDNNGRHFLICSKFLAAIFIKAHGIVNKIKKSKEKLEILCNSLLKMCNEALEYVLKSRDLREFYVAKFSNYLINEFVDKAGKVFDDIRKVLSEIDKWKHILVGILTEVRFFKRKIIESEIYDFSGNEKTFLGKLSSWICDFLAFADDIHSDKEIYYKYFFSWTDSEDLLAKISGEPLSSISNFLDEYKKVMPNASLALLIKQKREEIEKILSSERKDGAPKNHKTGVQSDNIKEVRFRRSLKERTMQVGRLDISEGLKSPAIAFSLSEVGRASTILLPKLPIFDLGSPSGRLNSLTQRTNKSIKSKTQNTEPDDTFNQQQSELKFASSILIDDSSVVGRKLGDSLARLMLSTKLKGQQYLLPSINTIQTTNITAINLLTEDAEEVKSGTAVTKTAARNPLKVNDSKTYALEAKKLEKEHPAKDYFSKMNSFLNQYEKTQFGEHYIISNLIEKKKRSKMSLLEN